MPLWGKSTSNENKPKWLTEEQKANTYATAQGWVYKHGNGTEELLVAIGGLAELLANATISSVYFANGISTYQQGNTKHVIVAFNEKVTVTGAPTLLVQGTSANATATYASGNNTNKLVFSFTVPAQTQTLSLKGQTLAVNSTVTIVDTANTSVNAAPTFANSVVVGVQAKAGANTDIVVA